MRDLLEQKNEGLMQLTEEVTGLKETIEAKETVIEELAANLLEKGMESAQLAEKLMLIKN